MISLLQPRILLRCQAQINSASLTVDGVLDCLFGGNVFQSATSPCQFDYFVRGRKAELAGKGVRRFSSSNWQCQASRGKNVMYTVRVVAGEAVSVILKL